MWRQVIAVLATTASLAGAAGATAASRATSRDCTGRVSLLVSVRTGAVNCSFPDINTSAVISAGDGGWFLGTQGLDRVGGVLVRGLARLERDGRVDRSWHGTVPFGFVESLALQGNTLYAGGSFGVEALDATTGKRLWSTSVAPATGPTNDGPAYTGITAIAANANAVFIDGAFSSIDGERYRDCLAALDAKTGRPLSWRGPTANVPAVLPGRPKPQVIFSAGEIALDGNLLILGDAGTFEFAGKSRTGLFAVNTQTGAIVQWKPRRYQGYLASGIFPVESGDGTSVAFAINGATLYRFEVDGEGDEPALYRATATNIETHKSVDWQPRLRSGGDGGRTSIAASVDQVFIG
jgi:outer membrane protein assembly factor BamB